MLFPLALVLVHIPAMPLLNNSKGIFIIRGYLYNNIQLRVSSPYAGLTCLQCSILFPFDLKSEGDLLNLNSVRQSDGLAILKRDNIIRHFMWYSG